MVGEMRPRRRRGAHRLSRRRRAGAGGVRRLHARLGLGGPAGRPHGGAGPRPAGRRHQRRGSRGDHAGRAGRDSRATAGCPAALAGAWRRVVEDAGLRGRLAAAAAEQAPEFDVHRTVAVIEDIYVRLAARRPAPSGRPGDRVHGPTSTPSLRLPQDAWPSDRRHWTIDRPSSTCCSGPSVPRPAIRGAVLLEARRATRSVRLRCGWPRPDGRSRWPFGRSLRWEFVRGGEVTPGCPGRGHRHRPRLPGPRAVPSADHARRSSRCRRRALAFVFNTPNDQSRPGYLRMGWRDVGRVPAAFRPTGPAVCRPTRSLAGACRALVAAARCGGVDR